MGGERRFIWACEREGDSGRVLLAKRASLYDWGVVGWAETGAAWLSGGTGVACVVTRGMAWVSGGTVAVCNVAIGGFVVMRVGGGDGAGLGVSLERLRWHGAGSFIFSTWLEGLELVRLRGEEAKGGRWEEGRGLVVACKTMLGKWSAAGAGGIWSGDVRCAVPRSASSKFVSMMGCGRACESVHAFLVLLGGAWFDRAADAVL